MRPAGGERQTRARFATLGLFALGLALPCLGAASLNYFEWSAVAPIVVAAESRGENGRYVEVEVWRVIRGDEALEGQVLSVDLKRANRNRRRSVDPKALRLLPENRYVLLLEPRRVGGADRPRTVYRLARGVRGARELPLEGAEAMIDVLRRFADIHELKNDTLAWERMGDLLEKTHPLLIGTALEQFEKFRRGGPRLTLSLRPLLDHPEPRIRETTARVLGQILDRYPAPEIPEIEVLRSVLIGVARSDLVVAVRVAATEALEGFPHEQVKNVLEEIASSDANQEVRYVAEKLLLEHRQADVGKRLTLTEQNTEGAPN